eukprot:Opistho-2@40270
MVVTVPSRVVQVVLVVDGTARMANYIHLLTDAYLVPMAEALRSRQTADSILESAAVVYGGLPPFSHMIVTTSPFKPGFEPGSLAGIEFAGGGGSQSRLADGLGAALQLFTASSCADSPLIERFCVVVSDSTPSDEPSDDEYQLTYLEMAERLQSLHVNVCVFAPRIIWGLKQLFQAVSNWLHVPFFHCVPFFPLQQQHCMHPCTCTHVLCVDT